MTPKENLLRAIRHERPEWVPYNIDHWEENDGGVVVRIMPPLEERPAKAGLDAFGVPWAFNADAEGGTFPASVSAHIATLDNWRRRVRFPDLDALNWERVRRQALQVDRERFLLEGVVEFGLFERSYLLLGMEEALIGYLTQPEEMNSLVGAIADYKIELIRWFHEVAKMDMVWYGDDWGTQTALFLPPETWRRIIKPHTRRVYDCMKGLGIIINQHSCGRIEEVFADMVEMGADIWNQCQPCNDLAALKRQFGRQICFCGGIDSQFILARPGATADEVRAEVRRRIDELADEGGYIAAPSHSVPYDPVLLAAMNHELATYGRRFYGS